MEMSNGLSTDKFNEIASSLEKVGESLKVTFSNEALKELKNYSQRSDVITWPEHEIAQTVAVLGYCSIGKAIYESLQRRGRACVYLIDISEAIIFAHKPDDPNDTCVKTVEIISKNANAFRSILPAGVLDTFNKLS